MLTDDEIIDALENAGISLAYRDHDEDMAFARAVEVAAYAKAAEACAFEGWHGAAELIRALAQAKEA